ncbi:MarR family winged helix-turn-helix transcriptional regulator [Curtobacterium sp. MCPF17_002]|uniref:MarR family winged helix-turn-helix transcriptional regulator n=1 Tax=Curtobacterium sp. MCPF17_002 TaxID=2175645 RepID=UPI0021ACF9CE|nr:MarR family winged helix-turn-helix transcriptional regulator [Curtobacterium sp. MCPF17_002]WIB78692.1 MarR family winged helix-turn-helix transcriptional regulator [Curtobacterium sp. MCPF17_002]
MVLLPPGGLVAAACNGRLYAVATKTASDDLVQLFDDLVRVETRLYNAVSDTLRREHGIVATQYEFLLYFQDHPESRIADVATNFAAGVGAISKGVDRLAARGWVDRRPNPADGRSTLVSLTDTGAALVAAADVTFRRRLAELVARSVDDDQVEAVGALLHTLRAGLERDRLGLPVG